MQLVTNIQKENSSFVNMAIENTHTSKPAEQAPKKKLLSFSNLTTALLICFALAMVFIPDFKGWTMQSLMKVGLFQPDIPDNVSHIQGSNTSSTDKINTSSNQTTIPDVAFLDGAKNAIKLSELKGKVVFFKLLGYLVPTLHCRNARDTEAIQPV